MAQPTLSGQKSAFLLIVWKSGKEVRWESWISYEQHGEVLMPASITRVVFVTTLFH